jgi:ubiquinone/menaquinone biosynthesis C-methylase UbiE
MKDEYEIEAEIYDKIWGKYDYDTDAKFLDELFKAHGCKSIIDVGCGTGNHATRLHRLGYEVTGVDVSLNMLRKAREKAEGKKIRFLHGDMKKLEKVVPKGERFDAAICLGNVPFHLMTMKDVQAFLNGVHKILRKNGLFVCSARNARKINEDYLNKLKVDHIVNEEKLHLLVLAYNTRHPRNRDIMIWRPIFLMNKNGKVDFQIREHKLRWSRFSDWKKLLDKNGFKLSVTYSGPKKEEFIEKEHMDMWFIATAK